MTATRSSWTHEYQVTLPGAPDRVFSALTDPAELRRWFAEHVEIEPREGGAYRFWGRFTYGVPEGTAVRQRLTRFERGRAIAFEWPFGGTHSEVTLSLEPAVPDEKHDGPRTRLSLRHAFAAPPDPPYGAELVDDLWRLTLGNLDAHLRGGSGIVLPDYTDPAPEIRVSILIDAPPDRVFQALVDPAALNKWIATNADVDARKDGHYRWGWNYKYGGRDVEGGPTRILDLVPNERLVTDWLDWRGDTTRPLTRVAWLLEPVGSKTKVTLIHDGFSRVADKGDYPFGWLEFLEQLKKLVEGTADVTRPSVAP